MANGFDFSTVIIVLGILLVLTGVIWKVGGNFIPLGKLPGDFSYEGRNWSFYFPLGTSILISIVLTLIFLLIRFFQSR